jgi:hypothetical protein
MVANEKHDGCENISTTTHASPGCRLFAIRPQGVMAPMIIVANPINRDGLD